MNKTITLVKETAPQDRPAWGDFFKFQPAHLQLSDGADFPGFTPVWQANGGAGEAVFGTGMTGYVETLTDPSYAGQILAFTSPLIGNYGVPAVASWESDRIHLRGVVVNELTQNWSHATGAHSLLEWLHQQQVPIITGVDTRALTKHLRARRSLNAIITTNPTPSLAPAAVAKVSISQPKTYNPTRKKIIIAVDCGMKQNILRHLINQPIQIKRVPYNYDYSTEPYDAVLLSNGPGDPSDYSSTINILKKALHRDKPIFGICLGAQLLALAAGARTYKLPFGHRSHNQPCATPEGRAFITSQNHGYAIDERSLPTDWQVSFRNLNDNSVEGIAHRTKPFSAVQFHPEAAPGPTDTAWLFNDLYRRL